MQYGPSYSMTDLGGNSKYKQSIKDASSAIGSLYGQAKAPLQKMMPDMTPYTSAFESMGRKALGSMRMPAAPSADQYKAYATQAARDLDDQRTARNQPTMQYLSSLKSVRAADATARPAPSPSQMTKSILGSSMSSLPQLRPGSLVSTSPQQREAIYIDPSPGQKPTLESRNAIRDLTKPTPAPQTALKSSPMQALVPATRGGQMIQPSTPRPSLDTRRARMLEDDVAGYDGLRAQGISPDMARGSMIANDAINGDLDRRTGEPGTIRRARWAVRQQADSQVNDAIARRSLMDPSAIRGNRTGIARINGQLADQQAMNDAAAKEDQLNSNAAFFDNRYAEAAANPMQDIVPSRDDIKLAERLQAQGRNVSAQDIAQYNAQDKARREAVREQASQLPGYDSMGRSPLRQRAAAEREGFRQNRLDMQAEAQQRRYENAFFRRHGFHPNPQSSMLYAMGQGTMQDPNQAMESFGKGSYDLFKNGADIDIARENGMATLGVAGINADASTKVAQIQADVDKETNRISELAANGRISLERAKLELDKLNAESDRHIKEAELEEQMRTNSDNRLDKLRQYQLSLAKAMQDSERQGMMMTPEGRAAVYAQRAREEGMPESQVQAQAGRITGAVPSIPDDFHPVENSQELVNLYNEYRSADTNPTPERFKQWLLTKNRYIDKRSAETWNSAFGAANRNRMLTLGGPDWTRGAANWSADEAQIVEDAPGISGYSALPAGTQPTQQVPPYNPNTLQDMFLREELERTRREMQRPSLLDEMALRGRA